MEPRVRLFLWAGTALLTVISLQPAGEVLAADWRGTAIEAETSSSEFVTADLLPAQEEDSIEAAPERRS